MRSHEGTNIPAILCKDVVKQFHIYTHRTTSLRELFIRCAMRRPIYVRHAEFSLRNINLRVNSGETVALVGPNGCGKSTVLRLIAGIYLPTSGIIETNGRIAAVIELGAGFHAELSGTENVELYATVMGLSRKHLTRHLMEIVEFAGIRDFMDMPVKYYSSGMQARLAFSVAINGQPDILLLDEVLAVGDQFFQERCFDRLRTFQSRGGTMVIVSHDLESVRNLCSRAIWLDNGQTRMEGDAGMVVEAYRSSVRKDVVLPPGPTQAE